MQYTGVASDRTAVPSLALAVKGLSLRLGGKPVLSDVTFDVAEGERIGIVGPNGAGKSTLLRCLAGWSSFDAGDVRVWGHSLPAAERRVRRDVVLVPDVPMFYSELTAIEHIRFVCQARGRSGAVQDGSDLLRRVGLGEAENDYPSSFSRGMEMKLALVLALVTRPRLLFLDEPWGSLDRESVGPVARMVDEALGETGTLVVVSHVWPEGTAALRHLRLSEGRVVGSASA